LRELSAKVVAGQISLLVERAVWIPDPGLMLLADAHIGKAQAFRRLGVPVPETTTAADLARMSDLLRRYRPRRLVFLGDLLHARHGRGDETFAAVCAWRASHADLPMTLVRGNHDSRAGDPPPDWDLDIVDEPWCLDGWALCHHPQEVAGHFALAGHVHPCVTVGRGTDRLRLPCFQLGARRCVLPAFGSFTGMHAIRREVDDRVAVVAGAELRWLPGG
jgi:uncharacterized protein